MSATVEEFKEASNSIFLQVAAVYLLIFTGIAGVAGFEAGFNLSFLASSVLAWGVIGWCQFALFNALHEGLHNRFGNPHRELLAYALAAYPVGFDASYRTVHLDHHKFFGDPARDPDYPNYAGFPDSKRQFLWRLFLNLCGWFALLQFTGVRQGSVE